MPLKSEGHSKTRSGAKKVSWGKVTNCSHLKWLLMCNGVRMYICVHCICPPGLASPSVQDGGRPTSLKSLVHWIPAMCV